MRRWFIEKLGGFPDIDSAIEAIVDSPKKKELLTRAVKLHFNTIGAEDILHVRPADGQWMFQGKPITKAERDLLIAEADRFINSTLWRMLQADVKYQANRKLYLLATEESHLTMAKSWIYVLDAIATRLKSMKNGDGMFNSGPK